MDPEVQRTGLWAIEQNTDLDGDTLRAFGLRYGDELCMELKDL